MRGKWGLPAAIWLSGWLATATFARTDAVSESLPERLTHREFWSLSADLSEPGASFISDNLVSNEMSLAQVIPEIGAWGVRNGVYLGVGPEQNFTYLEAMRARIGFIIDIRRENLLLHLLYKALFDLSPTRASFVSNLFSRPNPSTPSPDVSASALMVALAGTPRGTPEEREAVIARVARTLQGYGLPLSVTDLETIRGIQRTFHEYGPEITYATTQLKRPVGPASFQNLMRQADTSGQELGFLASEAAYHFVRQLQLKNLVIPVVGNFAGPKALRQIGQYLRDHQATVSAFYVSNVEDYLGRERSIPRNGDWRVFCANVASLPIDEESVFIRPLGLAAFDLSGTLRVSKDMVVASEDAVSYPPGTRNVLPNALSTIATEVRQCN